MRIIKNEAGQWIMIKGQKDVLIGWRLDDNGIWHARNHFDLRGGNLLERLGIPRYPLPLEELEKNITIKEEFRGEGTPLFMRLLEEL